MEEEILTDPLLELDNLDNDETKESPKAEEAEDNTHQDDQESEEEEKKELTAKEKRHAEQEAGRVAEVMRLRNMVIEAEVSKASQDAKSLLELAQKDPKLADEVAQRFGYTNFKDAKQQITAGEATETKESEKSTEEQFEERYQERKAKEEHETALNEAKSIIEKLPEDVQDEAIETFNDLIEGKRLTRDKAVKFANMVTLSLTKGKTKVETTDGLKKLSSTGLSNTKKVAKDEPQMVIFGGEEILLDSKNIN